MAVPSMRTTSAAGERRRSCVAGVSLLVAALLATGCSDHRALTSTTAAQQSSTQAISDPLALTQQKAESMRAMAVVQALARRGLLVPKPLDTTAQECPTVGCTQSVVTDTLRVLSFSTKQQADAYAGPRGLFWSQNLVAAFAPPIPASERFRYMAAIGTLKQ